MNIYFAGPGGSGKSYLCDYLIKNHGYTKGKMATSVYAIAEQYFGMKTKNRQLLQFIGTDVGRYILDNDIWVNRFKEDVYIAQKTAKLLYNKDLNFCSDDVRFNNEHLALREAGWIGIYLNVPDEIRLKRLEGRDGDAQVSTLNHISETEMLSFKDELIQLDSSGTLEQAYENLEQILEYIRQEKI